MSVVIEHKKGEVNELKTSLRNPAIDRDPEKKREVIKRVIAYMTLGIDVSKLFSEMIMATSTRDHVIKKMVYLYICNYASTNPDLSLLAINTLQKDCRDEDPMTRGLALRSFTSLRLPSIVEYLPSVIRSGLQDQSPYVRKTAVMSCVKLHLFSPDALKDSDIVNTLYTMLRDRDPQVVSNCICALNEVLAAEGGMAINKPIIHHLLNRMKEFNEWSQCIVLELVARYKPQEQQEIFDIMNLLEERLRHSNSAVVLAATKVFLNLTQDMPAVNSQVYARLKAPMLTLMAGGVFEQSFVCLKHIALLTSRVPEVFADEFKHFFCRYNEPACVKLLKLEILTQIVSASTVNEAMDEIAEYVTDVDTSVARAAVSAIGKMGVKVPSSGGAVVEQLMKFLEVDIEHVSAEAIISMKNLLRKYPDRIERFITGIGAFFKNIDEPEAKVALLWMIAEYGHVIPESPYLIEPMVDSFADETSQAVRLQLFATATKLFFRRPAEMQRMLGRLLDAAIADASFTDVHDRAMMYYRLLQYDVNEADRVLSKAAQVEGLFVEEAPSELQDRIFEEFNTLSVIYGEPSERFVKAHPGLAAAEVGANGHSGDADVDASAPLNVGGEEGDEEEEEDEEEEDDEAATGSKPATGGGIDLLGLMDDLPPVPKAAPPALSLSPTIVLDAAAFQQQWAALQVADSWSFQCPQAGLVDQLSPSLAAIHVKCMAFGNVNELAKFYFFAQDSASGSIMLAELIVNRNTMVASATIKASITQPVPPFSQCLKDKLGGL